MANLAVFTSLIGILIYILPRGHAFVQKAPLWIWSVFVVLSFVGAILSRRAIPWWATGSLVAALAARLLLDLREWLPEDVLTIKSIQRTLAYFFPFLGVFMIDSGRRVVEAAGPFATNLSRGIVIATLAFLCVSFLGWRWLEQPHYFFATGLLGLAAVEALAIERRRDPANRNIGVAAFPIAFLMGPGLGTCRSALLAGLAGFALFWVQSLVTTPGHWKRLLLTLLAFCAGIYYHGKVDRYSAGLRLLESSRVITQESGAFMNVLTKDSWSNERVEDSGPEPLLMAERPETATQQRKLAIPFLSRRDTEAEMDRAAAREDELLLAASEAPKQAAKTALRRSHLAQSDDAGIPPALLDEIPGLRREIFLSAIPRGELPTGLAGILDSSVRVDRALQSSEAHRLARLNLRNSFDALEDPTLEPARPWSWMRIFDPTRVPKRSSLALSGYLAPLFAPDRCALGRGFPLKLERKRLTGVYFLHNALFRRLSDQVDTLAGTSNVLWRLLVWRDGISELMKSPYLGIGFTASFNSPSVAKLLPDQMDNSSNVDLHNSWLQVFVRGGLLVGIPWLVFWFFAFWKLGSLYRPILLLWFVFSLPMVSFESPHLAIPVYLMLGLFPLARPGAQPGPAHSTASARL